MLDLIIYKGPSVELEHKTLTVSESQVTRHSRSRRGSCTPWTCECSQALWPPPALFWDDLRECCRRCSHAPRAVAFRSDLALPLTRWGNVGVVVTVMETLAPKHRRPPLLYGTVDLGPQPWVGCASRSWRENGGSVLFTSPKMFPFWTPKFAFESLWILTPFSFRFSFSGTVA
jgi:hypothetical protein